MIKSVKCVVCGFSILAFFLCKLSAGMTYAQDTMNTPAGNAGYTYMAREGDSLSRMVRHSIQLYIRDNKITLEPAKAMYCEAIVSQGLGNIRLEVGQRVDITMQDIQNCISSSRSLSADSLAGWQSYADEISFETGDLQPIPSGANSDKSESAAPQPDTTQDNNNPATPAEPSAPASPAAPEASEPARPADVKPPEAPAKKSAVSYWWYTAAGILAILYFLLGDRLTMRRNS